MFSTLLIDWLSLMRLLFYKMIIVCAGQLILPECMKLLPLYTNCLLKSGMKAVVTSSTPITLKQWCRSGSAWRMRIRTKELIIVRNDGERAESDEIPTPDLSAWSAACQHHSVMLLILQVVFFLQSFVCQDVKKKIHSFYDFFLLKLQNFVHRYAGTSGSGYAWCPMRIRIFDYFIFESHTPNPFYQ